MSRIKETCIIFNFNGVLVDTKYLAIQLFNEIAKKRGFGLIQNEQLELFRNLSIRERCKALQVPLYLMPIIGITIKSRYQKAVATLPAVDGIPELIYTLREKGYTIGFITSNKEKITQEFLHNNQIAAFDKTFYSNNPFTKSNALRQLLGKYDLEKQNVIYVGDEIRDIKAGKQAGVKCIGVSWGYDSFTLLSQESPAYVAKEPKEILSFLEGE